MPSASNPSAARRPDRRPARSSQAARCTGHRPARPQINFSCLKLFGADDHTTLVAAVKAAGLVGTLEGKGPFTVFAPTDEAFAALPKGTVETLLKPENKATLTKVLTCHVVAADAMAKTVAKMIKADGGAHDIKTVGGCVIKARENMGKITLTDENGDVAHVTIADVKQSNGVIHVVDKVLLPKM
ncbi:fasciclin domain-containing protein [Rhizobium etli]|uniref:fasciclin domain-containing protein n=1 Tax=Rhizobium etli TaxID=29449 RepID=UPI003B436306